MISNRQLRFPARLIPLAVAAAAAVAPAPTLRAQGTSDAPPRETPTTTLVGAVSGTVIDRSSRQAISDAQVMVIGTTLSAITDAAGRFSIATVPVGTRSLRIVRIGYKPAIASDLLVNPGRPHKQPLRSNPHRRNCPTCASLGVQPQATHHAPCRIRALPCRTKKFAVHRVPSAT